jgi:fused signal recognition particle receptor
MAFRLFRGSDHSNKTNNALKKTRDVWFKRIVNNIRGGNVDDGTWDNLEELLISADIGVNTSLSLVESLRDKVKAERVNDPSQITDLLRTELERIITDSNAENEELYEVSRDTIPMVILFVGVNGAGKTTSIAKLANQFREGGKKVLLGAADTFRAAAIEQLQFLGERIGVDVIAHKQGADPGAVAYDSYQAAKARDADVLIIDTAGRLHTKTNLMEELKKIRRVISRIDGNAPHKVILSIDATTGHNGLSQAKHFVEAVACDGIFLSKLDGTAKGGIVLSIRQELNLPILFIGTGEQLDDIAPFDPKSFVDSLLTVDS